MARRRQRVVRGRGAVALRSNNPAALNSAFMSPKVFNEENLIHNRIYEQYMKLLRTDPAQAEKFKASEAYGLYLESESIWENCKHVVKDYIKQYRTALPEFGFQTLSTYKMKCMLSTGRDSNRLSRRHARSILAETPESRDVQDLIADTTVKPPDKKPARKAWLARIAAALALAGLAAGAVLLSPPTNKPVIPGPSEWNNTAPLNQTTTLLQGQSFAYKYHDATDLGSFMQPGTYTRDLNPRIPNTTPGFMELTKTAVTIPDLPAMSQYFNQTSIPFNTAQFTQTAPPSQMLAIAPPIPDLPTVSQYFNQPSMPFNTAQFTQTVPPSQMLAIAPPPQMLAIAPPSQMLAIGDKPHNVGDPDIFIQPGTRVHNLNSRIPGTTPDFTEPREQHPIQLTKVTQVPQSAIKSLSPESTPQAASLPRIVVTTGSLASKYSKLAAEPDIEDTRPGPMPSNPRSLLSNATVSTTQSRIPNTTPSFTEPLGKQPIQLTKVAHRVPQYVITPTQNSFTIPPADPLAIAAPREQVPQSAITPGMVTVTTIPQRLQNATVSNSTVSTAQSRIPNTTPTLTEPLGQQPIQLTKVTPRLPQYVITPTPNSVTILPVDPLAIAAPREQVPQSAITPIRIVVTTGSLGSKYSKLAAEPDVEDTRPGSIPSNPWSLLSIGTNVANSALNAAAYAKNAASSAAAYAKDTAAYVKETAMDATDTAMDTFAKAIDAYYYSPDSDDYEYRGDYHS